ncbi:ribosomal protein S18-alanine N-acetyltransferase [Vibrio panuliri]|uniref:[Ribosomal protein bS18]-alanine N-acetyltransferase n=1 Tax=Vibrio panuliri TaxID=1381081 RepID=A0ABX3FU32_9VIBR|nr:ribosomal protein S18-alanine N-acetyltransferase [Vibrio panuliri]KAB1460114.1 ribosomal-protein-alanine N-acetyltransferase [Vibrio panuliri]OLQ96517.1 ribosomal-protein-alanine N-acetyltransferase [Vibrio panuliri]
MTLQLTTLATEHLDDVWAIELQAHSHPWAESMIRDLSSRGACHHVLLDNEQVVGYFYAQNIVGEVTLLNIAIAPSQQGKGFGKKLLEHFIEMCENAQAESAWLEVRESNHKAFSLYESAGFNEVDRRRNYYPTANGNEDAIIMSYLFLF